MGTKGIRLKMLLPLMVAIVLAETTGSQVQLDPEINLPAIVFRKEHGTPAKFRGATFQKNFCAAFPVADGTFLTSAHCLATAASIDLVGLGNVEIEKIGTHSKFDLKVFQLKNRNLTPRSRHVGLDSEVMDDTCAVLVLNKAFRWTVLPGATPTRCLDNASKDKICFKSEKTPAGLDFAVVCEGGRTLHAVFHGQRGAEVSFTVCSTAHCSEFVKQSATTRVKRQGVDSAVPPADDSVVPPADDPAVPAADDPAVPAADDPAVPAADDSAVPPADDSAVPPADDSAVPPADDSAVPPADDSAVPPADDAAVPPTDNASPTATSGSSGNAPVPSDSSAPAPSAGAVAAATNTDTTLPGPDANTDGFPFPPPLHQAFKIMPKKFPYPPLEVVQSAPVPTRAHKRPVLQNPYAVQAPKEKSFPEPLAIISMTTEQPVQQVKEQPNHFVSNNGDVSVQLPMRTESPDLSDLTEYEVLGTQDAPVLSANNDVKAEEAPAASPQYVATSDKQYAVPAAVQQQVQRPSAGGFAMAPADWRYSVTPRPQRRCKTTTFRPSCRAPQPSAAEAAAYNNQGQMAAGSPAMGAANYPVYSSPENYQPNQAMGGAAVGAAVAGSSRPVGPDPWMVAAQKAVPTGSVQPKDDENEPETGAVESSAERNSLAVIALVVANALYFML
ncbi:uncharacterized protein LOC135704992 [Ochlerotatus camptorhynchus]|uniref:uncharacterized protein LOC135704992 n=1 Tax=Ochlerotatus camptorhynchus TaxID=644619 RepID=UPI0031DBBA2B